MSYTEIFGLDPKKNVVETLSELRNSYGSAYQIWNTLGKKYLGSFSIYNIGKDFWDLYLSPKLLDCERFLLMSTYDNAITYRKDHPRFIMYIMEFLRANSIPKDQANHWPEIAKAIKDSEYPAIGFYWTSVGDNPFEGEWNEEKEGYDSLDWSQFWDLGAEFDEVMEKLK